MAAQGNEKNKNIQKATFAGGCFWCVEADFAKVPGVMKVVPGYAGGDEQSATYEEVSSGKTGHLEAVQVFYDPAQVDYQHIIDVFWRNIDPTDPGGQFVDRGPQYRTAIFYHDDAQKRLAEESKKQLQDSGIFEKPITTQILPFTSFYEAEEYHQQYYKKNPARYNIYRRSSGRDRFTEKTWKSKAGQQNENEGKYAKPENEVLREKLTPLQYEVTQKDATEPPFLNEFWTHEREGIYVDIVTGEPLFSSRDKFKSSCGWPSFSKPIEPENVVEKEDRKLFMKRTEVRSRHGDSHLGHVFNDGPAPTGLRYCVNSASLRFIPREDLEKEGYGEYADLFVPERESK